MNLLLLYTLGAITVAVPSGQGSAQDGTGTASSNQGNRYEPAFFQRSQPASAYDMIVIVPGFLLDEGDTGVRGYSGSGGNVLIDGQRPASKEDGLADVLKRIPASRVHHIELIRVGARGVDMQGHAVLANVVRNAGGQWNSRLEAENGWAAHGASAPRLAGEMSYGTGARRLDLNAAIYREIDAKHGYGRRDRIAADGSAVQQAAYAQPEGERIIEAGAGYRQPVLGGALQMNGLFKDGRKFSDIDVAISYPHVEKVVTTQRQSTRTYEGSARYVRAAVGGEIELLASHRAVSSSGEEREFAAAGSERNVESEVSRETIARAVYRRSIGSVSLSTGGETAINSLDRASAYFEGDIPVPVPDAVAVVRERRGEVFIEGSWAPSRAVSIEAGLRYEASRISQSGQDISARSFGFAKPRVRLAWSPGTNDLIRILFEREVGQLDFGDFTGSASITNGTVTAGNRDLSPESLWRAEITYERQLGAGSLALAARREWIIDVVDRLPLLAAGKLYDSVGNIGGGRRDEVEADLNLPLDFSGLKGFTVRAQATWRHSRVIDPVTGGNRQISGDTPLAGEARITHDLPGLRLRWGAGYVLAEHDTDYKVTEISRSQLNTRIDAFVEYKPTPDWTLRIVGRNLTDSPSSRRRKIYVGDYGSSALRYTEERMMRSGRYLGMNIQRTLGG